MKTQRIILLLCLFFVFLSFVPSFYEYFNKNKIPQERFFVLEHNYNFDYNFYLSRIRQGIEGKWFVREKYYNQPHKSSLFQIIYVYLGKFGGLLGFGPIAIYQISRFIFGFLLLFTTVVYGRKFFSGKKLILFFFLAVTAGSWPVLVWAGRLPRFATHMGWWSVIDSLQRITIMPHILIGQIFLVSIITNLSNLEIISWRKMILWGFWGLLAGIIFPPAVIIVYAYLMILAAFEFLDVFSLRITLDAKRKKFGNFIREKAGKIAVFIFISVPSLIYLQISFREQPWKALSLFDIEHRFIMPYKDYVLALGPVLILGVLGLFWAFSRNNRKFYSPIAWIFAISVLFMIFENVPEQSPLRFTEGMVHVPLAALATYFILKIRRFRLISGIIAGGTVVTGLLVIVSMILWLTDQAFAKRFGTWPVPLGAQQAYPLRDFMDGIFYLQGNTNKEDVVLGYITAGNYIPAYAGNYVYIGHANTPDEDEKEFIAASFYKGEMKQEEAKNWLNQERISYIFFGPQEKELGGVADLAEKYSFLTQVYSNKQVVIYKII